MALAAPALSQKGNSATEPEPPAGEPSGEFVPCGDERVSAILTLLYPVPPGAEQSPQVRQDIGEQAAELLAVAETEIGGPGYECRNDDGGTRSLVGQIDRLRLIVGD